MAPPTLPQNPHVIPADKRHPKQYRSPKWRPERVETALDDSTPDGSDEESSDDSTNSSGA